MDAIEFVVENWNEATGADVEVEGGEPFLTGIVEPADIEDLMGGGNSSTPMPSGSEPIASPTGSETEEPESSHTAGAVGVPAMGSLIAGTPLMPFAALMT